ncbi:MAG: LysM peptidoglycan-binding domain-containing protein [Thermoleophilia bacterium]
MLHRCVLAVLLALTAGPAAAQVTVRPGDTLSAIAARNGVSASSLAAANGIHDPNLVVAGTVLHLPGSGAAAAPTAGTVSVRPGDTLSAIAAAHGVSVARLAAANGITNPNLLTVGRRLRLPAGATGSATGGTITTTAGVGTITVAPGQTLAAIAAAHGTSVGTLVGLNGLSNPNMLRVGQTLRVPGGRGDTSFVTVSVARGSVGPLIAAAAARHGVDPWLARAVAWQESGFNQYMRSSTGAMGVMQLMPDTAAWVGPSLLGRHVDPGNVYDNIEAGVAYLAWLQRHTGSWRRTAMAYYQGLRSLRLRGPYTDTTAYATSVLALRGRV